jgi:hypothetical protein
VERNDRRERAVGTRIRRICYYMFKQGRPDTDFEHLIYLHSVNDSDIGDINHSNNFPAKVLPFISSEVTRRLTRFLANPLDQTGFRPCGKMGADKATWNHWTRQFVTFTTVVPDSANLLHAFFLGHPIVKEHTGDGVAQSNTECVKIYDINRSQYLGGSFDGAYFHLNVPEKLDNYFGFKGNDMKHHDWDPLHKAGLQDSHIRKDSKFSG